MTKVINIKNAPAGWKDNPEYVYIGRPGKGMTGRWGNPFVMSNNSDGERIRCYNAYRKWTQHHEGYLVEVLQQLRDKTLVCFCDPKLCHGHWLQFYCDTMGKIIDQVKPSGL